MKEKFISQRVTSFLVCLLLPLAAVAQPTVWVTDSLQRTGPTDPAATGTSVQLFAGRGEYESFQVIVQAPPSGLSNVNFSVSGLTGSGGATIPASAFSLFRENYVYINQSSPNWGGSNQPLGAGWYPDGLIPFTDPSTGAPIQGASLQAVPFNLSASRNQPLWVDLLAPATATPGAYSGTYTVTSDQGNFTGTIAVTVWHFTLPPQPSLHSAFVYWNADTTPAEEELLRNKISPLKSVPGTQNMLMNNFGLGSVGLPYFSGANVSNCTMSAAPSASSFAAASAAQQSGLYQFDYSADEVDGCPSLFPTLQQWGYNMHQAGVRNLATMAPNPLLYDDGSGTGHSAVDIWTMLPLSYNAAIGQMPVALAKGDSLWSYNALVQDSYSPKWMIDFAPINLRVQSGFISQSLGLTGLLYWRVDDWSADPWNQVNNAGTFSSNNYPGEGMLVYPGGPVGIAGVAPSMRLKWLRDGVEDYEYVAMLKAAGQGAWAMGLAASVGPDWTNWTRDTNLLASVRQQLGQQLDQLSTSAVVSSSATAPASNPVTAPPASTPVTAPVSGNAAPTLTSVTPASGSGSGATFTLVISDANGSGDLAGATVIMNTSVDGQNGCWFHYDLASAVVSLADDTGSSWSSVPQGSPTTISNSYCSIAGTAFGAVRSGNSATITVSPDFNTQPFAGARNVYVDAQDNEGLSSGYQFGAAWTVQ